MRVHRRVLAIAVAVPLVLAGCGDDDEGSGGGSAAENGGETKEVTIGWTPPDITGVFKTATDYFERAAEDAKAAGFEVESVTSFGQDLNGELYAVSHEGAIYRLTP